jgi:4-carboxymuconolactone decarboxylase
MKPLHVLGLCMMTGLVFLSGYGFRSALAQQKSGAEQSAEKLPPDIVPESLARVPWPTRDDFTSEEEKKAFDHVVELAPQNYKLKGPLGPTPLRLHLPIVAEHYYVAFRWLRDKAGLDMRYVELAILVSTRESSDQYQWLEHEKTSANVVPRETLEVVRNRKDTKSLDEKDAILIQFGREMYHQPKVSSKTFAEMMRLFGRRNTFAVTSLMAYYTANALLLHAFDQHLAPGSKSPFTVP